MKYLFLILGMICIGAWLHINDFKSLWLLGVGIFLYALADAYSEVEKDLKK
jgi:hypothetical protein